LNSLNQQINFSLRRYENATDWRAGNVGEDVTTTSDGRIIFKRDIPEELQAVVGRTTAAITIVQTAKLNDPGAAHEQG
jgi:hypothetical protein